MVKVLERTLELIKIAKGVCGWGSVKDYSCISINPLFRTLTCRFTPVIYIHPHDNLMIVEHKKYLPLALRVAEKYEERDEGDFTLKKDY